MGILDSIRQKQCEMDDAQKIAKLIQDEMSKVQYAIYAMDAGGVPVEAIRQLLMESIEELAQRYAQEEAQKATARERYAQAEEARQAFRGTGLQEAAEEGTGVESGASVKK